MFKKYPDVNYIIQALELLQFQDLYLDKLASREECRGDKGPHSTTEMYLYPLYHVIYLHCKLNLINLHITAKQEQVSEGIIVRLVLINAQDKKDCKAEKSYHTYG